MRIEDITIQVNEAVEAGAYYPNKDRINMYVCEKDYAHFIITKAVDHGVTPSAMSCRVCDGIMSSAFYRVDPDLAPTHEQYRPTQEEYDKLDEEFQRFVDEGGLLLRKATLSTDDMQRSLDMESETCPKCDAGSWKDLDLDTGGVFCFHCGYEVP